MNNAIDIYLATRRAGGFKLEDEETYLRSFARFAAARGDTHIVARTAIAWAGQTSTEGQRAIRMKAVIRLARFSKAEDHKHEIPPDGLFRSHSRRPTPYLFTDDEVQALMEQATRLGPAGSLRPLTYYTLIGLLAVTGLRISEAIALRFHDITNDGLMIRETKYRKSRLLPLDVTTRAALERYLAKRRRIVTVEDHVFVSLRRVQLRKGSVQKTFVKLLDAAGIQRSSGGRRPRLIDFRHSFASNALLRSSGDRAHVDRHTLALMTYLGHAHPTSTFWYLERSPQLMINIAEACERLIEEAGP